KTGVRTCEAAAYLRRTGADVTKVRKLFRERMEDYQVKAETLRTAEIFQESFAIAICKGEGIENPTILGAQAANDLLDIIGVKASIVFTSFEDKIFVSARSIDEVNVQLIMERLGGGGHLTAAGTQLKGCTIEEAKELVKQTILQMMEEGAI
ncbi:MAG: DHH family phosphoesterase, partial [Lachnospiraceae bacterium]|nr:DHH family phosphoesterase [Lachnospiraceae bacterium]